MITLQPMNICQAAADLVWSRIIKEFPDIKIALSEGGTGWIPYFLDRIDRTYDMHHLWTGQDFGDKLPSEVFREHFLTCFIADPIGVQLRHEIGIDNIAWECDYPHSDSSWPEAPEELAGVTDGVPDDEINKITLRERDALVLVRPVRPPGQGAVHGRRAAGRGRRPRRRHPQPSTRAATSATLGADLGEPRQERHRLARPRWRARSLQLEQIPHAETIRSEGCWGFGSLGRPRARSAMRLRWICSVPPPMRELHWLRNMSWSGP